MQNYYNKVDSRKLGFLVGQHTSLFSRCRHLLYTPLLAKVTDFYQDTFLEQLQYWMSRPKVGRQVNGVKWVKDSMSDWQNMFKYMSHTQVYRTIRRLLKNNLLLRTKKLNRKSSDNIYWYTINFDQLNRLFINKYPQLAVSLGIIKPTPRKVPVGINSCKSETGTREKSLFRQGVTNWNGADVNRSSQERPIPHRNGSHSSQERPIPHRNATTKSTSKSITKSMSSSSTGSEQKSSDPDDDEARNFRNKIINPSNQFPNSSTFRQSKITNRMKNRNDDQSQHDTESRDSTESRPAQVARQSTDSSKLSPSVILAKGHMTTHVNVPRWGRPSKSLSQVAKGSPSLHQVLIRKLEGCYININSRNSKIYNHALKTWIKRYGYDMVARALNLTQRRVLIRGTIRKPIPFINAVLMNLAKDKRIQQKRYIEENAYYASPEEIDEANKRYSAQQDSSANDEYYKKMTEKLKKTGRLPKW